MAECKQEWSWGTKQWKMAVLGSAFGFLIATQFEMKNPKCYKFPALALYPLRAADKGFFFFFNLVRRNMMQTVVLFESDAK